MLNVRFKSKKEKKKERKKLLEKRAWVACDQQGQCLHQVTTKHAKNTPVPV